MSKTLNRSVVFTAIGTALEWYEFGVFGYLAIYLAGVFFPHRDHNAWTQMLYTYGIFGLGFVTRPLGGIFFGHIGDRYGRKNSMILSSLFMAISMFFAGILPSYAKIGMIAPLLLVLSRLIQGFSAGGEYSSVLTSLSEQGDGTKPRRRGLSISLGVSASNFGFVIALIVVGALSALLNDKQMINFGWRIPFFIGAALGVLFFILRVSIEEAKAFTDAKAQEHQEIRENKIKKRIPFIQVFAQKEDRINLLKMFTLELFLGFVYFGLLVYMVNFLNHGTHDRYKWITNFFVFLYPLFNLLGGFISDYVGRRRIMLFCMLVNIVAVPLCFLGILKFNIIFPLIIVMGVHGCIEASSVSLLSEMPRTRVKNSTIGLSYNIASVFYGFAPMLLAFIMKLGGINAVLGSISALYVFSALFTRFVLHETAFKDLKP